MKKTDEQIILEQARQQAQAALLDALDNSKDTHSLNSRLHLLNLFSAHIIASNTFNKNLSFQDRSIDELLDEQVKLIKDEIKFFQDNQENLETKEIKNAE